MRVKKIKAWTVSQAMSQGLMLMQGDNVSHEDSRNGYVLVHKGPVITHTRNPLNRVLLSKYRDANPFFHLFESLWMLSGRNDLPWVAQFNKRMADYSDDGGKTQPAAYGWRWRGFFGYDQLNVIVNELRANPSTRRAVLAMWDGGARPSNNILGPISSDLMSAVGGSKDVPCNTECYFTIRDGKLDMSVQCRSNDLLWGAHGANAVHFSVLLEYVAAMVGVFSGEMVQYSWNYHLYDGVLKQPLTKVADDLLLTDPYDSVGCTPIFCPATVTDFELELPIFMEWLQPDWENLAPVPVFKHAFLAGTASRMFEAWTAYKVGNYELALKYAERIEGLDWQMAATQWIERRAKAAKKKEKK